MLAYLSEPLIFLVGGSIFYLIYVISNKLKNPGLAAIISLLPISLLAGFFINSRKVLTKYMISVISVFSLSLSVCVLGYFILKYTSFDGHIVIGGLIFLWALLQILLYQQVTQKFQKELLSLR